MWMSRDLEALEEAQGGRIWSPWLPLVGPQALSPLLCLPRSS